MQFTKSSLLVVVSIFLLAVAACTPSYINLEDLGTRSTPEEITKHYSGNSVRYASQFGGKVNVEAFYGADGTYQMVSLSDPVFSIGTWRLHTALGSTTVLIEATGYAIEDGKVSQWKVRGGYVAYIQPDGSMKMDEMGGGNFSQPKPTPGFQAKARFNALRRQAGL